MLFAYSLRIASNALPCVTYVLPYVTYQNIVHYYIEKYLRVAWVTTYVGTVVLSTDLLPYPYVLGYVASNQGVSGGDRGALR